MRSDPHLSQESLSKFYKSEYRRIYEGSKYPAIDALIGTIRQGALIYDYLKARNVTVPEHVFEIGCGTGGNLISFLLHGHRVAGCDYGFDFLEAGHKLGLDLREGGQETLEQDLPRSLIILRHVLEHFREPVVELRSLAEKLREEAIVYIEVPGMFSIRETYKAPVLFLQNAHAYHFCLAGLKYVMSLAGFEQVCGDENIRALYRPNSAVRPESPDPELHRQILRYLKRVECVNRFSNHVLFRQFVRLLRYGMGGSYERIKGRIYAGRNG